MGLEVRSLSASYNGVPALVDVSIRVGDGEFVTVVGPNGAGKTTLLKAISGAIAIRAGSVSWGGRQLQSMPAYRRSRLGLLHVPQGRRVFPSLTVGENLDLGAYRAEARPRRRENLDLVFDLFPALRQRREALAGSLSGGQQQMLAIGRALMGCPCLLMLDEPSLGLSPKLVEDVFERIRDVHRRSGMSILLVEQRAAEALELCDRGYVLEGGALLAEGPRDSLLQHEVVQRAYLGEG